MCFVSLSHYKTRVFIRFLSPGSCSCSDFLAYIQKPNLGSKCCWVCSNTSWMHVLWLCTALDNTTTPRNTTNTKNSAKLDRNASSCEWQVRWQGLRQVVFCRLFKMLWNSLIGRLQWWISWFMPCYVDMIRYLYFLTLYL